MHRPRFPALASGRLLTHAEHLAVAEINRSFSEIDAARARIQAQLKRGTPIVVVIVEPAAVS